MGKRKLTDEQWKKLSNNMALFFVITGVVVEIVFICISVVISMITKNWAWLIIAYAAQLGLMPAIWLLCGLGGLIFSILALKKVGQKKRYIVTAILSVIMLILMYLSAPNAMGMLFGIR